MDFDRSTVGGVGGCGSDSDWGENLRTTGPGPNTTLDLTHVPLIFLVLLYSGLLLNKDRYSGGLLSR